MSAPSWVKPRFRCTLDSQFCEIVRRLKSDVEEFRQLSGRSDVDTVLDEDDQFTIRRWTQPDGGCAVIDREIVVTCAGKTIVARTKGLLIEVTPQWDREALTCDLLVEQEATPVWQISQMILGEFLFES